MKRTPLGVGKKSLERGSAFASPRSELARGDGLKRKATKLRRQPVSPASAAQREKVRHAGCIVCMGEPVHPAHVIDRSIGGDDHPDSVVPLCPGHHRAYDEGDFSLLEHLEPHFRDELAHAVRQVGLISALQRITNQRWAPTDPEHEQTAPEVQWP